MRGPWITGSYYGGAAAERFHDGWLRTGDVGTVDERGYVQITDRTKDVIKSGGEWISSVELENQLMAHPAVLDAAVIGIPDERWQERPLAVIAFKPGQSAEPDELREFLRGKVAQLLASGDLGGGRRHPQDLGGQAGQEGDPAAPGGRTAGAPPPGGGSCG